MQNIITNFILAVITAVFAVMLILKSRKKISVSKKQYRMMIRILISAAYLLILQLLPRVIFGSLPCGRIIRLCLYFADYLIIGYDILKKAALGIKNRRVFDENFLMALATLGAMAIAIYENGDYLEAIAVMLFYQIGEWFQSYAVGKSRKSIGELMDIRPDHANIESNGELISVSPDKVEIGSIITVRPGEKIAIDGVVVSGSSTLNTSALTGESMPRSVEVGDSVISGCICMSGMLKIRTTQSFGESTVSKILDLVENASSKKSRSENFISKFAKIYTPAVCFSALALALLPPVISLAIGGNASFGSWIYRALTFLVISCPCALVISVPLSFFAGIGGASREGILIKGSNYIEALSSTSCAVFDKTGTLTKGNFKVDDIICKNAKKDEILEYAALAESSSIHPISKSIRDAYGKDIDLSRVSDLREISGKGVMANVDGISVTVGNAELMDMLGITHDISGVGTQVHVATNGNYAGCIIISDQIKPSSAECIKKLRECGVKRTVMLSGDSCDVVSRVAENIGIDEYRGALLPDGKVDILEELIEDKPRRSSLIFIGDGINDAPVLSRADVGIAMGALGSDAAIESADIVLMDDDPVKVAKAIRISKKCMRVVRENIIFALSVKLLCLILGALGFANMYLAIFADVGVMVLAVLNAMRCLFVKKT